jgi:hypothetical protein
MLHRGAHVCSFPYLKKIRERNVEPCCRAALNKNLKHKLGSNVSLTWLRGFASVLSAGHLSNFTISLTKLSTLLMSMLPRVNNRRRARRAPKRNRRMRPPPSSNRVITNPSGYLVPLRFRTTESFTETWLNNTAIPGYYDWVIRGNSTYDPDYALSADSCAGHDALATIYSDYKVISSRITVTISNTDATNPTICIIIPATFSVSFGVASVDAQSSYPRARHMLVSSADGSKSLRSSMQSRIMFDVKDLDSVNFRSVYNTNPATQWFWHVITSNNAGVASTCEMLVHVDYFVEWSSPAVFLQ